MALSLETEGDLDLIEFIQGTVAGLSGFWNRLAYVLIDLNQPVEKRVRYATFGVNRNHRFAFASCSKPMLGHLLADMISDGVVSESDTIGTYLAGLDFAPAQITLRQLAVHRGGFPRDPTTPDFTSRLNDYNNGLPVDPFYWTHEELIAHANGSFDQDDVGTVQYSNIGASLLGAALAAAANKSYAELLDERIFRKVLSTRALVVGELSDLPSVSQVGGHTNAGVPKQVYTRGAYAPSGGVWMSIADGARWVRCVLKGNAPGMAATTAKEPFDASNDIGYFWLTDATNNVLWHDGQIEGFRSFTRIIKSSQRAHCVLIDSMNPNIDLLVAAVANFDLA
ncbi:serine hydrolase domain-containing protein [Mycolicibacterium phlei]|uniref:serine hydrolase domain-containing protein n=1 Tax=Mycolicibacterium phlei TaxID=1771 RepID=UPI00025AE557|nr:serine hydrolase domain-containing protein [Mycolicibacterium phlei]EID10187.1 beta-lactamase [Mycolicibacterium phlei RIVM601174]MBF4194683.1 beta-lactamase [Mycolicibacterium phlei]